MRKNGEERKSGKEWKSGKAGGELRKTRPTFAAVASLA